MDLSTVVVALVLIFFGLVLLLLLGLCVIERWQAGREPVEVERLSWEPEDGRWCPNRGCGGEGVSQSASEPDGRRNSDERPSEHYCRHCGRPYD